jgi:hypothetical protein
MNKYVATTMSYGLIRKGIQIRNATITHYDKNERQQIRVPMLISDKVLITAWCGCISLYMWPLYLYNDLCNLEIILNKNLKHEWYNVNEKKYKVDYLFC